MSQYDSRRSSGTSHSRARGNTHGKTSRSGSRSSSSGNRGGYHGNGRRGGSGSGFTKLLVGCVVLIAAIGGITFLMKGSSSKEEPEETALTIETVVEETELQKQVSVDGVDITGMSREEAREAILADNPWSMTVVWEENTYEVADLLTAKVDELLGEIYSGEPEESYTLSTDGLEDAAATEAANVAAQWDKKAKNGSISDYDSSSDKFLFTGAENGQAVEQEQLASDILSALASKNFDAVITASVQTVEPEFSEAAAREKYKTVATFTTNTTANSKRNTNVKLAAQAINGTVLQPGETFSFNDRVGERTEAKGYQGAAAYNNGEVVEEIGGGVCQVSSTLYNAVVKAGLKTTVRRSHTYEPSYVTPGTDATVSWGGPDYAFVNNSSTSIGIRASYSNQTVTVSIYAIPLLEDGVSYSLKSTKLKDLDLPAPTYEEDGTLQPGEEKTKSSGSQGSQWETRLVITKNGETVSQDVDHTVTYKGHAPVILRNTSGTVAAGESSEGTETEIDPIEGTDETDETSEGAADSSEDDEESTKAPSAESVSAPTSVSSPTAVSSPTTSETTTSLTPGGSVSTSPSVSSSPGATATTEATTEAEVSAPTAAASEETIAPNPGG
ncbi:MAG: VanW family protein [Clostridiales bacterium]|nr:VanW family protein [Clostridiales bacterium]